jgi:aspartyl-tRNA(Asn)/glutamyl-tRNA(Gln) amidotransferase subunit A
MALNNISKNSLYIKKLMDSQHLDVLLVPVSMTGSATYNSKAMIAQRIASNSGLPSITFTVGYTEKDHMPIGIELIGREFSEAVLMSMAYAYEHSIAARRKPSMPPVSHIFDDMDIETYNQFLTKIGYAAYQSILSKCTPDEFATCLTAEKFRQVVAQSA